MKINLLTANLLLFILIFSAPLAAQKSKKRPKKGTESWNYLSHVWTTEQIQASDNKMEKAFNLFQGHFSNKKQADTTDNPLYAEQEIVAVPFWRERKGEFWSYWAWIGADAPETVLSQGVFRYVRLNRDTLLMEHYLLPKDFEHKPGQPEWSKPEPLKNYRPNDLKKLSCVNYIIETKRDEFEISCEGYCKEFEFSPMGEIQGMAIKFRLTPQSIHDYSEHFDKDGNLLFAYERPIGVYYERLNPRQPKYKFPIK